MHETTQSNTSYKRSSSPQVIKDPVDTRTTAMWRRRSRWSRSRWPDDRTYELNRDGRGGPPTNTICMMNLEGERRGCKGTWQIHIRASNGPRRFYIWPGNLGARTEKFQSGKQAAATGAKSSGLKESFERMFGFNESLPNNRILRNLPDWNYCLTSLTSWHEYRTHVYKYRNLLD